MTVVELLAAPAPAAPGPDAGTPDPLAVYLAGLAPSSRATVGRVLRVVAGLFGATVAEVRWHRLRYAHLVAIKARLEAPTPAGRTRAPATINAALAHLRGIAREAYHLGQLTAEDYERIKGLKPARGERLPAGRSASRGELAALLAACAADPGPAGARDGALLALLYAGGLRRAEAAALDLADYDPGAGVVRVRGKGNKERRVYLTGGGTAALADWLAVRGPAPGPLFRPVNKGGRIVPRRLSAQAIYAILQKRAAEAGLAHLSPHDLRRTFVGDLLDAGADLSTVQGMAGHATIATTARYDRRGDAARKRAAGLLHVPYVRRRGAGH